jgi:hypothetical protein
VSIAILPRVWCLVSGDAVPREMCAVNVGTQDALQNAASVDRKHRQALGSCREEHPYLQA